MMEMFFTAKETDEFSTEYKNFFDEYLKLENEKLNFNELPCNFKAKSIDQFIELEILFNFNAEKVRLK